jgi:hypothetical protein
MDSLLSFPVGLFHPLQHAGLSRRTRYTDYRSIELRFVNTSAFNFGTVTRGRGILWSTIRKLLLRFVLLFVR